MDGESPLAEAHWPNTVDTVQVIHDLLDNDAHILLEGTQGSGLSLHHGQWPHVTSADTNSSQLMADAGIPPSKATHSLLVARTYPIRVGGPSGPMFHEMDWTDFEGVEPERTTVTKKIRRIGGWDKALFQRACLLNDPCGIALTFLDYIDPSLAGATYATSILNSPQAMGFIEEVEAQAGAPVVMVGTGGERFQMVSLKPCLHGESW